jgi:hypothetical protein
MSPDLFSTFTHADYYVCAVIALGFTTSTFGNIIYRMSFSDSVEAQYAFT